MYRYSILQIGNLYFGVEVFAVKEVLPCPEITMVPNVHKSILGVFSLRGQIYSLVDLAALFMMKTPPPGDDSYVVILENEELAIGIAVDRVMDVLTIDSDKIQIPTRTMPVPIIQYSNGYFTHEKLGNIYLLEIPVLMNAKEIHQYRF